jgi:hypothetical protein
MTIQKSETIKLTHNCFTSLAGYLTNMLDSKDYVIKMFKEEIQRKNAMITDLLEKQDMLEEKLVRMEAILQFDEKDYERDHLGENEGKTEVTTKDKETTSDEQTSSRLSESSKLTDGGQE